MNDPRSNNKSSSKNSTNTKTQQKKEPLEKTGSVPPRTDRGSITNPPGCKGHFAEKFNIRLN